MSRKNLTARFAESVTVDSRTDFWDNLVRGLVLRVSPTGVKSWSVVYSRDSDGAKRRLTIGKFPAISLERARAKALGVLSKVAEGEDPAGGKRANRDAMTVRELGRIYLDKHAKREKKTWREDQRILETEVYPAIGGMKAIGVKRRDILDIIEAKAEAGKPAQSNNILAVVRKMFNWAVDGDYIERSPAYGIRPRGKPVRRDRVLDKGEVRALWNALPDAPVSKQTADVLRLLLLTGQRSGEVCGMRRNEVDVETWTWVIPAARAKNGRAHVVPLSEPAREIVAVALKGADDELDAPLFARVGTPVEPNAIAQAVRKSLQLFDQRWTPHDARRTVATGMAELGVSPHIVEACLNHISGFRAGVAGVYNRAAYEPEKRRALDLWAAHLVAIIEGRGSIVIPMRAEVG